MAGLSIGDGPLSQRCTAAFVDINGDGDLDAFIGNDYYGRTWFFQNNGTVVADLFVHELDRYGTYATATAFPPLHDPVALLVVTHPHLFERRSVPIAVETTGTLTRGMTVVDRRTRTRSGDDPAAGPITTEWVHHADAPAVLDLVAEAVA